MIADSDFENSIMKLTISLIMRKSSRGSGKELVIEIVWWQKISISVIS